MRRPLGFVASTVGATAGTAAVALLLFFALVPGARKDWFVTAFEEPALGAALRTYIMSADTLRTLNAALAVADSRDRAHAMAGQRATTGLLMRADEDVSAQDLAQVRAVAREELDALGVHEPAYPVAVVIMRDEQVVSRRYMRAVVLPAEAGAPCTVVLRLAARFPTFAGFGDSDRLLGTCGFFAVHGAPGAGMSEWLRETRMNTAAFLLRPPSHGDGVIRNPLDANAAGQEPSIAACRAGRLDGCARLFTADDAPTENSAFRRLDASLAGPPPRDVQTGTPTSFGSGRSSVSQGLLASLAGSLGPERFRAIWASDAAPAEAYAALEGRPIETWVAEYLEEAVMDYDAGAGLDWWQWLSALALTGVAVASVLRFSRGSLG